MSDSVITGPGHYQKRIGGRIEIKAVGGGMAFTAPAPNVSIVYDAETGKLYNLRESTTLNADDIIGRWTGMEG